MVTWTVPQRDTIEAPTFSLDGVFLAWPDGVPAMLKQTSFTWQDGAWQATLEVSSAGRDARYASGTIRLKPAVVAAWESNRLNPRREAANQVRRFIPATVDARHLGTITFSAV